MSDLFHKEEYSPDERRERYLRERALKGRSKNGTIIPQSKPSPSSLLSKRTVGDLKPPAKTAAQRATSTSKANAKKREKVKQLNEKLKTLRNQLKILVDKAKARSGSDTSKSSSSGSKQTPEKKLSAQEKIKAAKASKENYEKNKKEDALDEQLKNVRTKILAIQKKIKAAKAKANKQTVTKNERSTPK